MPKSLDPAALAAAVAAEEAGGASHGGGAAKVKGKGTAAGSSSSSKNVTDKGKNAASQGVVQTKGSGVVGGGASSAKGTENVVTHRGPPQRRRINMPGAGAAGVVGDELEEDGNDWLISLLPPR